MKTASKIFTGVLLAAAMTPALAATPVTKPAAAPPNAAGALQEGQMEVGGLFAWFKSDASDLGLLLLSGGYMFTDQLEAKLGWTALLGDVSGGFITPAVDFFLPIEAPVLPYVGGGYAMGYGDAADLDSIEVHFGVKQFLTERIALDYRFTYQEPTDSAFDSSQIMQVGFAYYL
jgi:opacity protein-like surface antigen